jgi:ribosomal protein S18 acetylase RimI-like enzyme
MTQARANQFFLHAEQIEQASQLLGRAFQDDPLMAYVVPAAGRRRRVLPSLFRVVLRYCLRYGTVFTTENLEGVACCLPPGQTNPTIGRLARISLSGRPGRSGLPGLLRFLHTSRYTDEAHAQAAPGPHWYLWVLGVEPGNQGQGTGGKLLQMVFQQAREQGVPCYLETENPRNVPFYQKHGFRLLSESQVSRSQVHIYAMLWENK